MLDSRHSRVGLATAAVMLSCAPLAHAGTAPVAQGSRHAGAPEVRSTYQAGYKRDGDLLHSASARFTVPAVDCSGETDQSGIALGIGNEPRELDATFLAIVQVRCFLEEPLYVMEATVNGSVYDGDAFNVAPGDRIKASFTQDNDAETASARIKNYTSGEVINTDSISVYDTSVTFGAFPLTFTGFVADVPDFDRVRFRQAKVDEEMLAAPLTEYNRRSDGELEIKTGPLDDASFRLLFKHR